MLKSKVNNLVPISPIPLADGKTNSEHLSSVPESADKTERGSSYLLYKEEQQREKIASEMLGLARDLKDQSSAMSQRLRSDCTTVDASIEQANRNAARFSDVLDQLSVELGSKCGGIVCTLFIISVILFFQMIVFMRLFRKRIYASSHTANADEL